jgi:hypothetical protein
VVEVVEASGPRGRPQVRSCPVECSMRAGVSHIFQTQEIPKELTWQYLALLPKADGGVRGIGLLEIVWKLVEAIIDNRISSSVQMIHRFRAGRGTGTAIIEVKLQQELASILHLLVPIFQVFVDLARDFDTFDRERTLEILGDYCTAWASAWSASFGTIGKSSGSWPSKTVSAGLLFMLVVVEPKGPSSHPRCSIFSLTVSSGIGYPWSSTMLESLSMAWA